MVVFPSSSAKKTSNASVNVTSICFRKRISPNSLDFYSSIVLICYAKIHFHLICKIAEYKR